MRVPYYSHHCPGGAAPTPRGQFPEAPMGDDPRRPFGRVKLLMKNRDFAGAESLLRASMLEHPGNSHYAGLLIGACGKMGRVPEARQVFDAAVADGSANPHVYSSMAIAYSEGGDVPSAREIFDRAVELGKANRFIYSSMLDAYARGGDTKSAREIFNMAVGSGNADRLTYSSMMTAHAKNRELILAREIFDMAVASGNADVLTFTFMLRNYARASDTPRAREIFDMAASSGNADARLHNNMMDMYARDGDAARAREIFDKAVALGCANEFTFRIMMDTYENAGAIRMMGEVVFSMAVSFGKADEKAYARALSAYYRARMFLEIDRAIAGAPPHIRDSARIQCIVLESLRKQKRYEEAIAGAERLLQGGLVDAENRAAASITRAYCLKELGRTAEAISAFRALMETVPGNSVHCARILCGIVFCGDVRAEEAAKFRQVLEACREQTIGDGLRVMEMALEELSRIAAPS